VNDRLSGKLHQFFLKLLRRFGQFFVQLIVGLHSRLDILLELLTHTDLLGFHLVVQLHAHTRFQLLEHLLNFLGIHLRSGLLLVLITIMTHRSSTAFGRGLLKQQGHLRLHGCVLLTLRFKLIDLLLHLFKAFLGLRFRRLQLSLQSFLFIFNLFEFGLEFLLTLLVFSGVVGHSTSSLAEEVVIDQALLLNVVVLPVDRLLEHLVELGLHRLYVRVDDLLDYLFGVAREASRAGRQIIDRVPQLG
jgi:hypothetical protein